MVSIPRHHLSARLLPDLRPHARQEASQSRAEAGSMERRKYMLSSLYSLPFPPSAYRTLQHQLANLSSQWLLSRQERAGVDPRYAWPQAQYSNYQQPGANYGPPGAYGMHAMPPPVYDPNNRPPMYDGANGAPMGGTKVDPVQTGVEPARGEYAPPPGPPPAR